MYSSTETDSTKMNVDLSIDFLFGDLENPGEVEQFSDSDFALSSIGKNSYMPNPAADHTSYYIEFNDSYSYPKTIEVINETYDGEPVLHALVNHIKVRVN